MSNTTPNFTDANIPTRSFGSDHDPVLDGVTRGIEALFPLVDQHANRNEDLEPMQEDGDA